MIGSATIVSISATHSGSTSGANTRHLALLRVRNCSRVTRSNGFPADSIGIAYLHSGLIAADPDSCGDHLTKSSRSCTRRRSIR